MRRLLPEPADALSDEELLADATPPGPGSFVRFSMVSSLDGHIAVDGRSGGLGSPADARRFALLRAAADAVVVGSGTALAEGYRGELLSPTLRAARVLAGRPERPETVVLSAHASLPPDAPVLTDAPAPTHVVVAADADPARVRALGEVTDVITVPVGAAPADITATLAARGLMHLHHEGGPGILGRYLAADAIDALSLTLSPLVAPTGTGTITGQLDTAPRGLRLHLLYEEDSVLLTEYRRTGEDGAGAAGLGDEDSVPDAAGPGDAARAASRGGREAA